MQLKITEERLSQCPPVSECVYMTHIQGERGGGREGGSEGTHLLQIWNRAISPSVRREKERKWRGQVWKRHGLSKICQLSAVSAKNTPPNKSILPIDYFWARLMQHHHLSVQLWWNHCVQAGVCTATCLPCRDGKANSSCVPQGL